MIHLCAFSQNFDSDGLQEINGVADAVMSVNGKNIQVPDFASYLMGAYNLGSGYNSAQLRSPSLRSTAYYEVLPTRLSSLYEDGDYLSLNPDSPISLDVGEQLRALVNRTNATQGQNTCLVWLCDGQIKPVTGEIFSIRATANTTVSAYQWFNAQLVLDESLPVGKYAVVGAGFSGTALIAYRFVFQDSPARPGGVGAAGTISPKFKYFSDGKLGVWGEFHSSTPPTIDLMSSTVEDTFTGYLDLIRIG